MAQRIYLDYNATTPVDPAVCAAMKDWMESCWGNPSSVHFEGQEAQRLLTKSRRSVAACLGVSPQEIIFTSGATEALNLVLRGFIGDNCTGHMITSDLEHPAVYKTCKMFEDRGMDVSFLSPGLFGAVQAEAVAEAIRPDTRLITLMAVNNETGVKTDLAAVAAIAMEAGIPFVVDGVALLGKESLSIPLGVTAMCFSAHKVYGPKGVGCCFLRKRSRLSALCTGGSHEQKKRPGTENLIGIAGFAMALEIVAKELPLLTKRLGGLRERLEAGLKESVAVLINGSGPRICNTSNLAFKGVSGEALLMNLDLEGVSVSHGSACSSGALEPSRVLLNMGLGRERAASSLRFSLGRANNEADVDRAIAILITLCRRLAH